MLHRFQITSIGKQKALASFLLFNTFSWYYLGRLVITKAGDFVGNGSFETLILEVSYPASIVVSAIVGSILLSKVAKHRLVPCWIIAGTIAPFLLASASVSSPLGMFIGTVAVGASLGVGMPASLDYFKSSIPISSRGKTAGITLFAALLSVPLIYTAMSASDLLMASLALASWRAWCVPLAFAIPKRRDFSLVEVRKSATLGSVLRTRVFLLYFVAWSMFSLVDFRSVIGTSNTGQYGSLVKIVEPACAAVSTIIGGIVSDWIGRKKILIFGFVSLGVAYATLGLFSNFPVTWVFYFIIDGVALGFLWVLFMIVLWGDMASNGSEKFYALGETPFFLAGVLSALLAPYLAGIEQSSVFSLAAFFLFLAVLPLLLAPETLPEKNIKDRELKMYIADAKKMEQKYP